MMRLAGLNITDDCALELVRRLRCADFAHQADTIEGALVSGQAEDRHQGTRRRGGSRRSSRSSILGALREARVPHHRLGANPG